MMEWISITLKYDGFWSSIKDTNRRKYEGGKQKTIKVHKDVLNVDVLKTEIVVICPWLRGYCYELHYYIHGTSPKEYKHVRSEYEGLEMIRQSIEIGRTEIAVALEDVAEIGASDGVRGVDGRDVVDFHHTNYEGLDKCATVLETYNASPLHDEVVDVSSISIGTRFVDSTRFKHFLRSKAIIENFGVRIKASDKTRVIAVCSHRGCPWRIRASLCVDGQTFEVRKFESLHVCPGINRAGNKQATCSWVAREIEDVVKKQPDIPPKQINNTLEATYGLSLPYMKLWRSRELARDLIFGEVDDNYRWVPSLRSELLNRNPGSHITYTCDGEDNSFKRFFVSFKVCVDGFRVGCRHLVGLDACHLKSKYLGVLMSANSLDGNNGLFTIAFAVVESESKSSWQWFLENLMEAFDCQIEPLAFMSDMEKGLAEAIRNVFPLAEHRVCMRHLWKNIKKSFRCQESQKIQSLVWTAANAYTNTDFQAKMQELSYVNPVLHSYLAHLPYKWARSEYIPEIRNHYNTNNIAESFNAWISEVRGKPVTDLIDMVRAMLMEQRSKRKMMSYAWQGDLVPIVEEYIREVKTRKDHYIVRQSTTSKAEVEGKHERHLVDIDNRECTCRFWQLSGLPCSHAVAFIGMREHPLWHLYVDNQYFINRYRMAYDGAISALPGKELWNVASDDPIVGVPKALRPRGRPKKTRFKSFMENTNKKLRRIHKCSRCSLLGHHRSTCKNPLSQATSAIPAISQEFASDLDAHVMEF